GCPEEKVLDLARMGHLLRDAVAEGGSQVLHRLVEDVLDARAVEGVLRLEQAETQVAIDLVAAREMDAAPVDHRSSAQHEPQRLEVAERPLLTGARGRPRDHGAEPRYRRFVRRARRGRSTRRSARKA